MTMKKSVFSFLMAMLLGGSIWGHGADSVQGSCEQELSVCPLVIDLVYNRPTDCREPIMACEESCALQGPVENVSCVMPLEEDGSNPASDDFIAYKPFWIEIKRTNDALLAPLNLWVQPVEILGDCPEWEIRILYQQPSWILSAEEGPVGTGTGNLLLGISLEEGNLISMLSFQPDLGIINVLFLSIRYSFKIKENCRIVSWRNCYIDYADTTSFPNEDYSLSGQITETFEAQETVQPTHSTLQPPFVTTPSATNKLSASAWRVINPVKNEVTIFVEHPLKNDSHLSIYSMDGRLIDRHVLPAGQSSYTLPASHWISGVYLLRLDTDSGVDTRKIIKY